MPRPTAATPDPSAAYAWPWAGTVPVIPFWTTHEPGSDRIHRTVPALWHWMVWHWAANPPGTGPPGVNAATTRTAASDRRRTHTSRPRVTFTPRSVPSPAPHPAPRFSPRSYTP